MTERVDVPAARPPSFLIVQDDPKFIHSVNAAFRPSLDAFNMVVADKEEELKQYFDKKEGDIQFDLIVLDFDYEELDALALLKRFRSEKRFEHVPIVVLAESENESLKKQAKRRRAITVSPKTRLGEMVPTIVNALQSYRSRYDKNEPS